MYSGSLIAGALVVASFLVGENLTLVETLLQHSDALCSGSCLLYTSDAADE